MNDAQFNACYRAVKEYLADIGFVPIDNTLKTMLKSPDLDIPGLMVSNSDVSGKPIESLRKLMNDLKYEDGTSTPTHYFIASKQQQEESRIGKYGELTDNINMFARALGDYVRLKYQEFTHTEGPNHEFTQYNHYHIKDFYKTHNDGDELLRFKSKFDSLIVDLKLNNIITEITRNKKISPEELRTYSGNNPMSHVAYNSISSRQEEMKRI